MGRIAGTDAGVGCFDQQPAFHPSHSAQRRTGKEEGEREEGREREMQRGEGGREATATAASMHRCSLLNVSISPSLLASPASLFI